MNEFELAVPAPVIPPSDVEKAATELMAKISTDGCVEVAARIKAKATLAFDTTEPTEVPDFLLRKNAEEQAKIQQQLAILQERSEPS